MARYVRGMNLGMAAVLVLAACGHPAPKPAPVANTGGERCGCVGDACLRADPTAWYLASFCTYVERRCACTDRAPCRADVDAWWDAQEGKVPDHEQLRRHPYYIKLSVDRADCLRGVLLR